MFTLFTMATRWEVALRSGPVTLTERCEPITDELRYRTDVTLKAKWTVAL